jgi:hypothetical protein
MKKLLIPCCIAISLWSCSEDSVSPVKTEGQPSAVTRATEQRVDFKSTDAFVRKDGIIIPLSRNHIDRVYSLPEGSYELVVSKKGFAGYQTRVSKEELVSLAEGRSHLTMKKAPETTMWFWPGGRADTVSLIFDAKYKTSITIEWGDGSVTTQSGKRDLLFSHVYSGDIYPNYQYEGYLTTNMNAITSLELSGDMDTFFPSGFPNLTKVVLATEYMFNPNLYQSTKLEYVDLTNLSLVYLDLPPDNSITTLKLSGLRFHYPPDDNIDYIANTTYANAVNKNLRNGFIDLRNITGISYDYENGVSTHLFDMKLSEQAIAQLHILEQDYGWTVLY